MPRIEVKRLLQWNPNWKIRKMAVVTNLVFHHVAGNGFSIFDLNNMHLSRGWNGGAGYNRYVRKNGEVFEGRPLNVIPAQCTNFNTVAIGVAVEGNYETEAEMPEVQKLALIACVQDIIEEYPQVVNFWKHSDKMATACPGRNFPYEEIIKGITGKKKVVAEAVHEVKMPTENETLELQKILNKLGFLGENRRPLLEDGKLGTNTKTALKQFQTVTNIDVDGVAGTQTWGAINDILDKPVLKIGNHNSVATRYLQWKLGISRDGRFGTITDGAVRKYQQAHGLEVDGAVGTNTWASLIG